MLPKITPRTMLTAPMAAQGASPNERKPFLGQLEALLALLKQACFSMTEEDQTLVRHSVVKGLLTWD